MIKRSVYGLAVGAAMSISAVAHADAESWDCTWYNDTFSSQGPMWFMLKVNGPDVALTVDAGGNAFGGSDPDPIVVPGTIDGSGNITLSGGATDLYGSFAGTLMSDGTFAFDMMDANGGFFPLIEFRGTWTDALVDGTSVIYFEPVPGGGLQIFAEGRLEGEPGCYADIDANGTLSVDDIQFFVDSFIAQSGGADVDRSGTYDVDDIGIFVCGFLAGCD